VLPEDQRQKYIAAWNRMRDCARNRGFDGVMPLGPTFGDGQTPVAAIDMGRPRAGEVLNACPLDTKSFDDEVVKRAITAARVGG
jgi:hypothetical protein